MIQLRQGGRCMDFLNEQRIFYTSKKYENVYIYFNNNYKISYDELFTIAVTIGFRNNKCVSFSERGREFRSNYLKRDNKATIYSILLNDEQLGKQIDKFKDSDFILQCRKRLEEYAEGGIEYMVEKIFCKKWDGVQLDDSYDDYLVDLMTYVFKEFTSVPF